MNFFAHQDQARAQTRRMLVLFGLAVVAIVIIVDVLFLFIFRASTHTNSVEAAGYSFYGTTFNFDILAITSLATLAVIGLGSLYRIASLSDGGAVIAAQLGATFIPPDTNNFAYRRLRNIVEEIAIASGVPVPHVFVLEQESGINAFAAGYTPADAAVTVTRGCLDKLTRDELQGVIAHEFSHIINGDMRLNLRLTGILFGILVIAIAGQKIAQASGRSRRRNSGNAALFGFALMAVGYIGVFFGRLIKASISRHREYLADASAVQFTRQTNGIANALKKIGGLVEGSKLNLSDREEVAHMLFGDGVGYFALFATHPPLNERIKRLDPSFKPAEFGKIAAAWSKPLHVGEDDSGADVSIAGFAPGGINTRSIRTDIPTLRVSAHVSETPNTSTADRVGHFSGETIQAASVICNSIPEALRTIAYSQEQAMSLMLALVLNHEDEVRAQQLLLLGQHYDPTTCIDIEGLAAEVAQLHPLQRLPLATLTFPALRRRPPAQLQEFVDLLHQLIHVDGIITLDEYCLTCMISTQVIENLNPSAAMVIGRVKLPEIVTELAHVFALVAHYGQPDLTHAMRAYHLGMHEVLPSSTPHYSMPDNWQDALDQALPRLNLLTPAGKELVVRGLTLAISANGKINVAEADLLRMICATLHCPLPLLLT